MPARMTARIACSDPLSPYIFLTLSFLPPYIYSSGKKYIQILFSPYGFNALKMLAVRNSIGGRGGSERARGRLWTDSGLGRNVASPLGSVIRRTAS